MKLAFVLVAIIILILVINKVSKKSCNEKLKNIRNAREALSKEDYCAYYVSTGYEMAVVNLVYDEIAKFIAIEGFQRYPEDDLERTYDIDLEDLEDQIPRLLRILDWTVPDMSKLSELNEKYANKHTAQHLIEILSNSKK